MGPLQKFQNNGPGIDKRQTLFWLKINSSYRSEVYILNSILFHLGVLVINT